MKVKPWCLCLLSFWCCAHASGNHTQVEHGTDATLARVRSGPRKMGIGQHELRGGLVQAGARLRSKPPEKISDLPCDSPAQFSGAVIVSLLVPLCICGLALMLIQRSATGMDISLVSNSETEQGLGKCFFLVFANHLLFTAIIPDSYALAMHIGQSAAFSGFLVGCQMGATGVGYIFVWVVNKDVSDYSVVMMRELVLRSTVVISIGMLIFSGCLLYVKTADPLSLTAWMVIGRCVAGIGSGIQLSATRIWAMRVCEPRSQTESNATYMYYLTVGLGAGPIAASVCKQLVTGTCGSMGMRLLALASLKLFTCGSMLISAWSFPAIEDVGLPAVCDADAELAKAEAAGLSPHTAFRRKVIIVSVIIVAFSRSAAGSSLEVGTAMILERDLGFSTEIVGWIIGAVFLCAVPHRALYKALRGLVSINDWIRISMIITLIGSALLLESLPKALGMGTSSRLVFLIAADVLLFPSLMLVGGLVEGIGTSMALPPPSQFTLNTIVLVTRLSVNCVGRLFGPILARDSIDRHGQDGYAVQQIIVGVFAYLLIEFGILRQVRLMEDEMAPHRSNSFQGVASALATPRQGSPLLDAFMQVGCSPCASARDPRESARSSAPGCSSPGSSDPGGSPRALWATPSANNNASGSSSTMRRAFAPVPPIKNLPPPGSPFLSKSQYEGGC